MSSPRRTKKPVKEITGAITPEATPKHETHGGYTEMGDPVLSVARLVRGGKDVSQGPASFETLASYRKYLESLTIAELHRHAVEEVRIVAIDDRSRLIRRLETEWTGISARQGARGSNSGALAGIPKRTPFTQEQIKAQEELKKKMLKGL